MGDESVEDFAKRVREVIGTTLKVNLTNYTVEDKEKYIKQLENEKKIGKYQRE